VGEGDSDDLFSFCRERAVSKGSPRESVKGGLLIGGDVAPPASYLRWKTNGKAERFIQAELREWAYARAYQNSDQRIGRVAQLAPPIQLASATW
jgi:hypothetical protein